ncbi:hypothetical protein D3C80_1693210 [compost metagenome]
MTDEAHLRKPGEGRRASRDIGLLGLCVEYRRLGRGATEQRPRIQADALHATVQQQAIEHPLGIALGKEVPMPDLNRQWPLQAIDKAGQLSDALRGKRR